MYLTQSAQWCRWPVSHYPSSKKPENTSSRPTIPTRNRRVHCGLPRPPACRWVCRDKCPQPFSPSIARRWPPFWRSTGAWCGCAERAKQWRWWSCGKRKAELPELHTALIYWPGKKNSGIVRHTIMHLLTDCDGSVTIWQTL